MDTEDHVPQPDHAITGDGTPWQVIYAGFMGLTLCAFGLFGGVYLLNTIKGLVLRIGGGAAVILALGIGVSCTALLTGARWSLYVCRGFALVALVGLIVGISCEVYSWVNLSNAITQLDREESTLDKDMLTATTAGESRDKEKVQVLRRQYDTNRRAWRQQTAKLQSTHLLVFFLGVGVLLCGTMAGLLFRPTVRRYCWR